MSLHTYIKEEVKLKFMKGTTVKWTTVMNKMSDI